MGISCRCGSVPRPCVLAARGRLEEPEEGVRRGAVEEAPGRPAAGSGVSGGTAAEGKQQEVASCSACRPCCQTGPGAGWRRWCVSGGPGPAPAPASRSSSLTSRCARRLPACAGEDGAALDSSSSCRAVPHRRALAWIKAGLDTRGCPQDSRRSATAATSSSRRPTAVGCVCVAVAVEEVDAADTGAVAVDASSGTPACCSCGWSMKACSTDRLKAASTAASWSLWEAAAAAAAPRGRCPPPPRPCVEVEVEARPAATMGVHIWPSSCISTSQT